ncbi:MAG: hypothetical protein ACJ8C4_10455 [Gemmataceae bacterium]
MIATTQINPQEVVRLVHMHTTGQVRDLEVEVWPGRVVLRGQATSYYVKQLAQHDLRQQLPANYALENLIAVANGASAPRLSYFDPIPKPHRNAIRRPLIVPARTTPDYVVA